MSPSHRSRSHRPVASFSRSLISFLNSALSCLFPSAKQTAVQVYDYPKVTYTKRRSISRPRHLKPILSNNIPASKIHFIHYLPVELLSLIFIIGSKQDSFFPIVISHVCSAWRQIALRTPELWCRILLSPQESMWRERVRRSRACFLDIQLCSTRVTKFGFHRSQDLDPYSVNWYMQIVFPHIRRWRSLDIDFTQQVPHLWKAVLAGCFTPAPWLEELSLKYRLNDDTREFFLFASFTPRLRRLRVDGIRLIWTPSLFGNLTFLDYTHHGFTSGHQAVQDVISILVVTSRITELRVLFPRGQIACLPSRREVVTQRATLPFLNHLVLKVDGSDIPFEIAHLVTLISSPTLSILRLIDLKRAHDSFQSLKSFFYVYPLPPSLRFIYIGHAWYDPSMVHAMVHSLPRLWKILIRRSRLPEQVLYLKNPTIGMDGPINHAEEHKLYQSHLHQLDVHYFPVCSK
ncbi:hypothetical protein CVT25_013867 [Psilocybe cyanescens]|uniref:Uncharacterized protein n=1 Tax=Psilocybe cyanescens TaxID=93625 RepID=A0A409XG04_PSICY|nr:hypothetical protein CVT25_013867 [Psilocybe cyanescens]